MPNAIYLPVCFPFSVVEGRFFRFFLQEKKNASTSFNKKGKSKRFVCLSTEKTKKIILIYIETVDKGRFSALGRERKRKPS